MNIEKIYSKFLEGGSVSIDTRTLRNGDIYFGLKGPNFDGNIYATQALNLGAAAVVVDDDQLEGVRLSDQRYLLVDDTLATLQRLASLHRERSDAKVIGITGSNGKTTSKELIAAVLEKQHRIIFTKGNLNNHIGVPLTLLRIEKNTEIAIIEMGANHIGEIKELAYIAKPDMGFITNIGKAHIEGFRSLEGVRIGKGELYEFIKANDGHIFVHSSDTVLTKMARGHQKTTYYSQECSFENTTVRAVDKDGSLEVSFTWGSEVYSERTNLYGDYNVPNILAALNIGFHFGVSPPIALKAISEYIPENSRSQRLKTKTNEIYLDAYNANPTSMEHALKAFASVDMPNKVVVLGDMFELGAESLSFHQDIAACADDLFDHVVFIGNHFNKVSTKSLRFPTTAAYKRHLSKEPILDSTILLKGSRGMALEELISEL